MTQIASISYPDAKALFDRGLFEETEEACRAILKQSPRQIETLNLLASTLARQQRTEEHLAALREIASLKPNDVAAQGTLALALVKLGRNDGAIPILSRVIELD